MKRIPLIALESVVSRRPPDYMAQVLAAGRLEAGFLYLTDEAYLALRKRFSGDTAIVPADPVAERFVICQQCRHSRNNGFDCEYHKDCCFGRWRSNPANHCPLGKWPAAPTTKSTPSTKSITSTPEPRHG